MISLANLKNCFNAGRIALASASDANNWKMDGRSEDEISADEVRYAEAAISDLELLMSSSLTLCVITATTPPSSKRTSFWPDLSQVRSKQPNR